MIKRINSIPTGRLNNAIKNCLENKGILGRESLRIGMVKRAINSPKPKTAGSLANGSLKNYSESEEDCLLFSDKGIFQKQKKNPKSKKPKFIFSCAPEFMLEIIKEADKLG